MSLKSKKLLTDPPPPKPRPEPPPRPEAPPHKLRIFYDATTKAVVAVQRGAPGTPLPSVDGMPEPMRSSAVHEADDDGSDPLGGNPVEACKFDAASKKIKPDQAKLAAFTKTRSAIHSARNMTLEEFRALNTKDQMELLFKLATRRF